MKQFQSLALVLAAMVEGLIASGKEPDRLPATIEELAREPGVTIIKPGVQPTVRYDYPAVGRPVQYKWQRAISPASTESPIELGVEAESWQLGVSSQPTPVPLQSRLRFQVVLQNRSAESRYFLSDGWDHPLEVMVVSPSKAIWRPVRTVTERMGGWRRIIGLAVEAGHEALFDFEIPNLDWANEAGVYSLRVIAHIPQGKTQKRIELSSGNGLFRLTPEDLALAREASRKAAAITNERTAIIAANLRAAKELERLGVARQSAPGPAGLAGASGGSTIPSSGKPAVETQRQRSLALPAVVTVLSGLLLVWLLVRSKRHP
jgi:hypothetical protein